MSKSLRKILFSTIFVCLVSIPLLSYAGIGNNVFGFAWSDNIGWISFNNCYNPDSSYCNGPSYGTNYQNTKWSGYAWSPNIGWISFNPSDWGECPPYGTCSASSYDTYNNAVAYNSGNGVVTNWVWGRALNGIGNLDTEKGGDYYDGWIAIYGNDASSGIYGPKISSPYTASGGIMNGYRVSDVSYYTNSSSQRIAGSGWAWGGNVIGWIDMAIDNWHSTELYIHIPKLLLTANPSSVPYGNTTTDLTWTSPDGAYFSSCVGLGGSSDWNNTTQLGLSSTNKTRTKTGIVVPASPTTFKIKCTTSAGVDVTAETSVSLSNVSSNHSIHLDASPSVVSSGGTTTLSWYSPTGTNFVGNCTASGGGSDWNGTQSKPTSSTSVVKKTGVSVPTSPSTQFRITCPIANGGSVTDTVDVYVNSSSNLSISANPSIAQQLSKISLTYNSSSNTTYASCTGLGGDTDWNSVSQTALSSSNSFTKTVNNIKFPYPNPPSPIVIYGITCTTGSGLIDTAFTQVALNTSVTSTTSDIALVATPTTVSSGNTTTLYWYSPNGTNFSSCTSSGGGSDWGGQTLSVPSNSNPKPKLSGISVPYTTTIYNIGCITNTGVSVYSSAMVKQSATGTSLVLSASPTTVNTGGTTSLTWSSPTGTSFSSCVGSGGDTNWNKSQSVPTGTSSKTLASVGVPTYPLTTYFLECKTSSGATEVASAQVSINHTIHINLSANPPVVISGGSSDISWTVDNATPSTSCSALTPNGWTSQIGSTSSPAVTISNITQNKSFTLKCDDSYTGATDTATVNIGVLSVDSFSKSGTCINQGVDARLNWSSSNATGCTIKYYSGGYSLGATPNKTFNASSTASNYVTTGASTGDFTVMCSNGGVSTAESAPITVSQCPPKFSVISGNTCSSGNPNSFTQITPNSYTAKITFNAIAQNGFSNNISLSVPSNGYGGLPASAFSWTSTSVSLNNGTYSKDLNLFLTKSQYNSTLAKNTNTYSTIKIDASGSQNGTTTNTSGSYAICGPAGSQPVPIFRPI